MELSDREKQAIHDRAPYVRRNSERARKEYEERAKLPAVIPPQPEFEKLAGVEILRVPGSDFAALPGTGRRSSAMWCVFKVGSRQEYCQLTKKEVRGWLIKMAQGENEE